MATTRACPTWPEELFEKAATMWRDGRAANQIAALIGKSRNAVLGMMHRNGVLQGSKSPANDKRRNPGPRKGFGSVRRIQPRPAPNHRIGDAPAPKSQPVKLQPPSFHKIRMDAIPHAPASLQLPLAGLKKRQCRWPTHEAAGKHLFCGAGTGDAHVYCPIHERAKTARGLQELRSAQPCG